MRPALPGKFPMGHGWPALSSIEGRLKPAQANPALQHTQGIVSQESIVSRTATSVPVNVGTSTSVHESLGNAQPGVLATLGGGGDRAEAGVAQGELLVIAAARIACVKWPQWCWGKKSLQTHPDHWENWLRHLEAKSDPKAWP
jgi:hypothetical protein